MERRDRVCQSLSRWVSVERRDRVSVSVGQCGEKRPCVSLCLGGLGWREETVCQSLSR